MTRTQEILAAVDRLAQEWDRWSEDTTSPAIEESSPIDDALTIAIDTCRIGDVPSQCRELIDSMGRLGLEYDLYAHGECVPTTGEPLPKFYAAYQSVLRARQGAEPFVPRQIESVGELRRQNVSDIQIARIYGYLDRRSEMWVGPFFGRRGEVLVDQIALELKEPGKVITADWIHPQDAAEVARRKSDLESRMNRLSALADEDKPPTYTEDDVVRYLKEGAFPAQAARMFRIGLDEVVEIANRNGIKIGSAEAMIVASEAHHAGEDFGVENMSESELNDRIVALHKEGMEKVDIVKKLSTETRQNITIQKVVKVLAKQQPASVAS